MDGSPLRWNDLARLVEGAPVGELESLALRVPGAAGWIASTCEDDRAAAHYANLVHSQMPCASLVFEPDAMVGGSCSLAVQERMVEHGFIPDPTGHPADHLVTELDYVAYLNDRDDAERSADFIAGHLAGWAPLLTASVKREAHPYFSNLMLLLDGLLTGPVSSIPPIHLPPLEDPTEKEGTSLAGMARYLATPARSGLLLTRYDLMQMGRSRRLPMGFGSRARTLEALLRSAAEYGETDYLFDALLDQVRETGHMWNERDITDASGPYWKDIWGLRLDQTARVIRIMRDSIHSGEGHP